MNKTKKLIFSGIRATGRLHLGNYLGAIKGMLQLQDDPQYEMIFAVVDLHAMTTPYDQASLSEKTRAVVLDYLAAGLDPEKSELLVQSKVADLHAELSFYFSTVITKARLQHLPTFKEKVKQHSEHVTMALLNYPVLMAADILAYHSELVPVGIDQEPHLEVTREIARKMNAQYETNFPEPKRFATVGEYVPSLTGQGKMSKSVPGSFINLTDDLETIKARIAGIPTDSGKGVGKRKDVKIDLQDSLNVKKQQKPDVEKRYYDRHTEKESLGVSSLMKFVDLFLGQEELKKTEEKYFSKSGLMYKPLKDKLATAIYQELKPIQEKRRELEKNLDYVEQVIEDGACRAREIASDTLVEVRSKMGLI